MLNRLFLFMLMSLFLLTSCTIERKHTNPFDPLMNITTSPSGLTLEQTSVSSIQLSWNDTFEGETGYRIDRKIGNGVWQQVYAQTNKNVSNYVDDNIQLNVIYYYQVYAQFDENYSLPISGNLNTIIAAPTQLVITQTGVTTDLLQWQDNSAWEDGFIIDRKAGTENWVINYDTVVANQTLYSDTDLILDVSYSYRIRAYVNETSSAYSETTTITPTSTVATPVMNPAGGVYSSAQTVTISCTTAGATIRYTTNGSLPTSSSTVYSTPISLTSTETIKAKAFKTNWTDSPIASESYTIEQIVALPTINPASGTYTSVQTVTVSCTTAGATIRYTTNGNEPTSSSTVYSSSFNVSSTTTVKAKAFKTGWTDSQTATSIITITSIPVNLVLVQGGTFNNGISNVTVSSFYLDKYEITQASYETVMGSNPASGSGVGSNYPVYSVSWFNAIEYCNKRSIGESLTPCYSYSTYGSNPLSWPTGWNTDVNNNTNVSCSWTVNGYRLPTEAEWQFAARGGNSTHNYTYSGSNTIDGVAWYGINSGDVTHIVGTKTANELGLFDMTGNVWEWTWDIYGTYSNSDQNNPHGAVSGLFRIHRGGSWNNSASDCTVSGRFSGYATVDNVDLGFRVCKNAP